MNMVHPLETWMKARMSQREFARLVGIHESHLSNVLQGKSGLSLDLAVRIEGITDGEFTAARLLHEQKIMTERTETAQ